MSERKVIQKYFPPDFDPSKIPRGKRPKNKQQVVRLMAPFSMKCNTCAEYIYKGKKFNARKETVEGEHYFNIKIFRFYIKCTRCSAEITFKTDPKTTDYVCEHGAMRNFEPWREEGAESVAEIEDRLEQLQREEEEDPMKSLETRTVDSKREMDILDKLQEIRGRNARMERADTDKVLERISTRRNPDEMDEEERLAEIERLQAEEEDEELVRRYFARGVVPSIELEGEDAEGAVGDVDGLGEGGSGTSPSSTASPAPPTLAENAEAGPSGTTGSSTSAAVAAAASATPSAGPSVKRKLAEVEPDAHSLLSDEAKKIASSVTFKPPPLPKKKQKGSGSSLLGIKLKSK